MRIGKVHQVFAFVRDNVHAVKRAEVKARLLTLPSKRAKFNQFNVRSTYQLCNKYPETREHFLVTCERLKCVRAVYLNKIRYMLEHSSANINILLDYSASCTQLLLDSCHPDIDSVLQLNSGQISKLELYSRELIFKLHLERTKILPIKLPEST